VIIGINPTLAKDSKVGKNNAKKFETMLGVPLTNDIFDSLNNFMSNMVSVGSTFREITRDVDSMTLHRYLILAQVGGAMK